MWIDYLVSSPKVSLPVRLKKKKRLERSRKLISRGREFIPQMTNTQKKWHLIQHSLEMSSAQTGFHRLWWGRWEKALGEVKVTTAGTTGVVELSQAWFRVSLLTYSLLLKLQNFTHAPWGLASLATNTFYRSGGTGIASQPMCQMV